MDLAHICAMPTVLRVSKDPNDLMIFGATDRVHEVTLGSLYFAPLIPGDDVIGGIENCNLAAVYGASAIVIPSHVPVDILQLSEYASQKLIIIESSDVLELFAKVTSALHPERPNFLAGVTGTNGKSSTVSFAEDIWSGCGLRAASMGTCGIRSRKRQHSDYNGTATTFSTALTHRVLEQLARQEAITHVAIEASARGLHQHRLSGLEFDIAAYTNLSHDHLDYHGDIETYAARKAVLFESLLKPGGVAVLNADEPRCSKLLTNSGNRRSRIIRYSLHRTAQADIRIYSQELHDSGQALTLEVCGKKIHVETNVVGAFQAANILCAIGIAVGSGCRVEEIERAASLLSPVPGRLELVATLKNGARIYVDYAHTDAGLSNVLKSVRAQTRGKVSLVFGCGGDRDQSKRARMGAIASRGADYVYVTDDNPRSEEPEKIRNQITAGISGHAFEIADRRQAIKIAIESLGENGALIVAGKGPEDCQVIGPNPIGIKTSQSAGNLIFKPHSDTETIKEIVIDHSVTTLT